MLRDEATPIESVATAQKEMAEIEKMKAYDDYCLFFFDHVREAINFRLGMRIHTLLTLTSRLNIILDYAFTMLWLK